MASGKQRVTADSQPAGSALAAAIHFIRTRWLLFLAVSGFLLVPCFWQRRIQAGDLASHVYNAWLAQLIERGQAPGLWIAPPVAQRPVRSRAALARQSLRPGRCRENRCVRCGADLFLGRVRAGLSRRAPRRVARCSVPGHAVLWLDVSDGLFQLLRLAGLRISRIGTAVARARLGTRGGAAPGSADLAGASARRGSAGWRGGVDRRRQTRFTARPIACGRRRRGGADCDATLHRRALPSLPVARAVLFFQWGGSAAALRAAVSLAIDSAAGVRTGRHCQRSDAEQSERSE